MILSGDAFYIQSAVVLRNGILEKDGVTVFKADSNASDFLNDAYEQLNLDYPRFYKMDLLSKTGTLAVDLLLRYSFDAASYQPEEVGIVFSNRNASVEADAQYWQASQEYPSPALFVYTLPNIVIGELSIRYKWKGENAFFISEEFDAEWMHWYVTDLMQRGLLKACVCGWVDVIGDQLEACMFLVEANSGNNGRIFNVDNLNSIYKKEYGN